MGSRPKNIRRWLILSTLLGVVFVFANFSSTKAATGINQQVNFQGRLLNSQGATVPDGNYNIEFKIYQDGDGQSAGNATGSPAGSLKWTEDHLNTSSQGVTVRNGYFSVQLGSITAFGSNVNWNQDTLWLSLNIGGTGTSCTPFSSCSPDGEMLPMKRLSSNPYALNSGQLGGLTSAQFIQLAQGLQTDSTSSTPSIYINKTASGNLLQLQSSGNDAFTLTNSGDISFGGSADHTISVATAGSGVAGKSLTLTGGAAGTGGSALAGGNLVLQGGAGGGTNGAGGNVSINAGAKNGSGADGTISIGTTTASAVTISKSGVTTTVAGDLSVSGTSSLSGATTITSTLDVRGSGGLTLGVSGPSGTAGQLGFANASNTNMALVQAAAPTGTGNATYTIPAIAGGSSDTFCLLTVNNCGNVTASGGTAGYVARFTGATALGIGTLTDDGSGHVGINNASSSNPLAINSITTSNSFTTAAQLLVGTNGVNNNGILIQEVASQSSTTWPLMIQNSSGASGVVFGVTATGQVVGNGAFRTYDQTSASTNSGAITLRSGNAGGATSNSGNVTVDSGTATGTTGSVSIGTGQASSVSIGRSGVTTAIAGTLNVSAGPIQLGGTSIVDASRNLTNIGTISSGTVNGQTISTSANFTGTLTVQGSGGLTLGVGGSGGTTGSLKLANTTSGRMVVIQGLNPSGSGDATIQVPSIAGGSTDTFCLLTSHNCISPNGGTQNYLTKYTDSGATVLGNSSIFDNGSAIIVGGSTTSGAGLFNVGSSNQFKVTSTGAVTAVGLDAGSGLIQGSNGLSVSGTITFPTLNTAGILHTNSSGVVSTGGIVLGTDTTGNYVANLGSLTGLTTSGNSGAGSTPTLSVTYGSGANTAVQGNTTLTCASGSGNLTGGGTSITLGSGGTCGALTVVNNPTFSGLITGNGGLTVATGSTFTNASSTLLSSIAIANHATGGNIGTAAATVDVATTFDITQTTAGQTLTLPDPTTATSGRIAYVNSLSGNASFTMYGVTIAAGTSASFIWNGTVWVATGTGGTGVNTIGTLDAQTKSANGAVISGSSLFLQSADATYPGLVSTGAQTFAGSKTFAGDSFIVKSPGNSATSFQIQNSTGTPLLTADQSGSSGQLYIGSSTFTNTKLGITTNLIGQAINETGANDILQLQSNGSNVITVSSAGNFAQTGSTTFSTGTGAVSLNGATTISGNTAISGSSTLTVGTGATSLGGTLAVTGDASFSGLIGVGTAAPTHALTLANGKVAAFYNTTDQTTNYERVTAGWSSNIFTIATAQGGTGSARNIAINGQNSTLTLGASNNYAFVMSRTNTSINLVNITSPSLQATSGTQIGMNINPAINQSSSAGYTMLLINPSETATGSGAKTLLEAQLGGSSKFKVDNAGNTTIAGTLAVTGTSTFTGALTGSTSVLSPQFDVASAGTLSLGTSTATALSVGKLAVTTTNIGDLKVGSSAGSGTLFTNTGASLYSALALSNFASGGSIGAAASTVDKYTYITVNQTTSGQTLTIPSPTTTTAGRLLYISNIGSTNFTLLGATISTGVSATLVWNGSAWTYGGADGSSILNQNGTDQSASFRISGSGQLNTSLLTPLVDTASAATLALGTTNATAINLNQNTTVAAGKLFVVGTNSSDLTCTSGGIYYNSSTNRFKGCENGSWITLDNYADVQTYTSGDNTWTKPNNSTAVQVILVGAGGGGGGGGAKNGGAERQGGGGGGGGAYVSQVFASADLASTAHAVVGSAGSSGAGAASSNTNGTGGGGGGTSCFSSGATCGGTLYAQAYGGGGGAGGGGTAPGLGGGGGGGGTAAAGGNSTTATGATGGNPLGATAGNGGSGGTGAGGGSGQGGTTNVGGAGGGAEYGGGGGGGAGGGNSTGGAGGSSLYGAGGGGAGGSINSGNSTGAGGAGGVSQTYTAGGGASAGTAGAACGSGGTGTNGTTGSSIKAGGGGGGGGANGGGGGTGCAGGNGAAPGGGGGGGGAGSGSAGAGGTGGAGEIWVISW